MAKAEILIRCTQFDPQKKPWPKAITPWPHNGYQPRDCSWGFVECEDGKVHVLSGDWIITFGDDVYICKERNFKNSKNDYE